MEFATLLSAAGVKVTVIVRSGQPLEGFYSQHVHQLVDEMKTHLVLILYLTQMLQLLPKHKLAMRFNQLTATLALLIKLLMPVVEFLKLMH